jgi:alpha/beta superfamily hydrolase
LLMRRPEIAGFIAVAPPANVYDFSFLAPCPASGMIIHGAADEIVPQDSVARLADRLNHQRGIKIEYRVIPGASHFFSDQLDQVVGHMGSYLDTRLAQAAAE